jgi:hypothetical protein
VKRSLIAFVLLLLGSAPFALACSCAPPPADLNLNTPRDWAEWRWQSPQIVFEGKVEHIELLGWPLKPQPGKAVRITSGVLVTFSSVRFYRGETREHVQVETGLGGGDCGYPFRVGESYLVDAERDASGRLTTGICDATNLLQSSATALRLLQGEPPLPEDLALIPRGSSSFKSAQPMLGKICGKVSFPPGATPQSVEVRVWPTEGDERSFLGADDVESESDGSFCLSGLDPGDYIIGAADTDPGGSAFRYIGYYPGVPQRSHAARIEVKKGASAHVEFALSQQPLFVVRGSVHGIATSSAASVQVMLAPDQLEVFRVVEPVQLGPDGSFEFAGVPPGRYTVFATMEGDDPDSITFMSSSIDLDIKSNIDNLRLEEVHGK